MIKRKKGSKYGNTKVETADGKFDSKKELKRYEELKLLEKQGIIQNLQRQVKYELIPAIYETEEVHLKTKTKLVKKCVQLPINYVADYVYVEDGKVIISDCKASFQFQDPVYRLKKKMMRYFHGITIKETY